MRLIYIILLISLIPITSAISTTMLPAYQPGETMIIEIQGNILKPIDRTDIVFKRAHVAIAVDYDIKRILDKYYLYAQLPTNQNNYTLFINNIATTVNGQNQIINYNQSFIVSGNLTDYSISPGFISTNKDFSITIKSNLDQKITININFPEERAESLNPGTNTINFKINSISSGIYSASIGKYTIPIQIINTQQSNQSKEISISVFPKIIRETIEFGKPKSYNITLTNTGNETTSNLYFIYNNELFSLDKETILEIKSNSSENIVITLNKLNIPISETILLEVDNEIINNITLDIQFTSNKSEITNFSKPEYYCSELGGKFCAANEICSTQTTQSLDGSCCTGTCNIQEESSSSTWIFYTFVAVVIVIILIIYVRYRKTKLPKPQASKSLALNSILKRPI